jgi:hypothetical protein
MGIPHDWLHPQLGHNPRKGKVLITRTIQPGGRLPSCLLLCAMRPKRMRYDYIFIAFGIFAGAALALIGPQLPASLKALPPLLWLLLAVLAFDLVGAYARGVPVMESVSTNTRVIAFVCGAVALILSGGLWN